MNKAFFSYSLNSTEEFIVTRLAADLQKEDYTLESSRNMMSENIDFATYSSITKSNLFIGVMSVNGNRWERVLKEYYVAKVQNIPALLLAEDTFSNLPENDPNIILFNRHRMSEAIQQVQSLRSNKAVPHKPNQPNLHPLVFGGAAVLGLIALMSNDSNESNKKLKKKVNKITTTTTSIKKLKNKV